MSFRSALITGAGGFIGQILVSHLLNRGVRVIALGRKSSSFPPGTIPIRTDSFSASDLGAALGDQDFDVLFHLAAYGVRPDDRNIETMLAINVTATGALVQLAAQSSARAIVYAGSCSEYEPGEHGHLINEDWRLAKGGLYGASKIAGGIWGRAVAAQAGLAFSWIRLFGIYGPGEAEHRLIPDVVGRLRKDQVVSLTPGQQVRDFMFVDDAAAGLILAAEAALEGYTGPYNLCTGQPTTVKEVACAIARKLDKPESLLAFSARPYRSGEPMWMVGCPDRFRSVTGHHPAISLDAGIDRTIAAIKD
jgi:UDP-glucose 4-epimerase